MRAYSLGNPAQLIGPEDLERHGVLSWRVSSNKTDRDATVARIKREHRYVDQDVVELLPDTPNLAVICAKFDKEHYHTEDEVRVVLEGDGVFDVRDDDPHSTAYCLPGPV
jgi:Uncharacterized conserved protein, contains double-stranded beta-helix domain